MALATTFFALLLFISLSSAVPHYHVLRRSQLHYHHHNPSTTIINGAILGPVRAVANATTNSSAIQQACKATRFPDQCFVSLTQYKQLPPDPTPLQILQSAMDISTQNVKAAQPMVQAILDASGSDKNRSDAARSCLEYLRNSETRANSTARALPRGKNKDARAWMGAILDYQYGCWNTFKYVNGTKQVNDAMAFFNTTTIGLASNALSMLVAYDLFGNQTGSWGPPSTERDGFWELVESGSGSDFAGGFHTGLQPDVTVCQKGGCEYETVQAAVEAAPSNAGDRRFVIWIKAGVYNETVRVPFDKKNVVFLGDGIGKTVITGSLTMPTTSTYNTATVGVLGDGFMAKDLTIENTAGPDTHQAVAFRSDSDLSIIENCEFLGNQDTLYAKSLRQYYKSCRIEGNIDFIFGNSAAFFQNCTILIRPRQLNPEKGENNAVTAHGRTDPAQSSGFVFQNCLINGTEEYMKLYNSNPKVHKNYLGRPWKEYSRTVFINCDMEALVAQEGWMPWDQDFALKTLYYGEFGNKGLGANLSKRVNWSSVIPPQYVNAYSVQNFIQGNEWIQTSA